jgi:hypothetical protein
MLGAPVHLRVLSAATLAELPPVAQGGDDNGDGDGEFEDGAIDA